MHSRMLLLALCVLMLVPGLVLATGTQERVVEPTVAPVFPDSDDVILRQGLPAVRDRRVNLEFLTIQSGDGFRTMEQFLNEVFSKYYPNITVDAQPIESGQLDDIVNTRLAAGSPVPVVQGGGYADRARWARAGVLLDVTDMWEEYNLLEIIPEGVAAEMRVDGRYIALPYNSAVGSIMYYNLNLIRAAGAPEPPYETWDDFFAAAEYYVDATGEPFFVDGYAPPWFGFVKSGHLAASYYGVEGFFRIANGRGTLEDFRQTLSFHKQLLVDYGNPDYMSMDSIAGSSEAAARGDGAAAWAGGWGYPRFDGAGMVLDEEWMMTPMPAPKYGDLDGHIMIGAATGFLAFKGSGFEDEARALLLAPSLKESQLIIAPSLGFSPVRSDIDPAIIPEVGRYPITQRSAEWYATAGAVIDRNFNLLPPQVRSEMPPVYSSFFAGDITLDDAAQELLDIQSEYQDEYVFEWGL